MLLLLAEDEFLLIGAEYLPLLEDDLLGEYDGCLELLLLTVEFLFIDVGELERFTLLDVPVLFLTVLLRLAVLYLDDVVLFLATLVRLDVLLYRLAVVAFLLSEDIRLLFATLLLRKELFIEFLPKATLFPRLVLLKAILLPNWPNLFPA